MKTVYLDLEFRCHVTNAPGRTAYETEDFEGCCDAFIEGFRLIPEGESWTKPDGMVLQGEMTIPAVPFDALLQRQAQYEEDCMNMMSLREVSDLIEIIYANDLEVIG